MIEKEVKGVLPESYDFSGALWYESIKKDYDSYRFLILAYIISILLPVIFVTNELFHGRTALLLNYGIPCILMILMLIYLVIFKNIRVMRVVTILIAIAGFFFAILLPGSYGAYIIMFFNFIPLVFSLTGLKGGVRWFAVFISSVAVLAACVYSGLLSGLKLYFNTAYAPVSFITVFIMFAIMYTGQRHHEKAIKRLVRKITYDSVTGLPNKDSFIRCMNGMNDSIIAILHITNFKNLATLFGYEFSDSILVSISGALDDIARQKGFRVYKLAWHEFGLQIPVGRDFSIEDARAELDEILSDLRQMKISSDNIVVNIALSIGGVLVYDGCYDNALSRADNALCTGLSLRRNITMHHEGMNVKIETLEMMNRYTVLHENIVNRSLKSYLQPVVLSATGEICGYESLLRIKGSDGKYESIGGYIKIAKDTGLYPILTDFMLGQAGVQIKEKNLPVSVNICPLDIMNSAVFDKVKQITGDSSYIQGSLILEIIESEELSNIEECIEFVRRVKSIGVRVAIDDFGSGYSNIVNLLRLGLDIVKIDGEVIRRLEFDNEAFLIIKGVSNFCRSAGYSIVAEYIENENIYKKVMEIGVEYCQGYLFGRPADPDSAV